VIDSSCVNQKQKITTDNNRQQKSKEKEKKDKQIHAIMKKKVQPFFLIIYGEKFALHFLKRKEKKIS